MEMETMSVILLSHDGNIVTLESEPFFVIHPFFLITYLWTLAGAPLSLHIVRTEICVDKL